MTTPTSQSTYKAVRYDHFGSTDVYYIADVPMPSPASGQALVRVKAAGINPGETAIRIGTFEKQYPSTFPSGQGSDFAGIIEAVGDDVSQFAVGNEVIGFTNDRKSQAEYIAVDVSQLIHRPANVSWEQGGSLFVAGTTAYAGVAVLNLQPGELVVVSGAAGGVGSLAVQLAKNKGAEVIGLASPANHDWLRQKGVTPVAYGDNTGQVIRDAAQGRPIAAFFDTFGHGYVDLALELGIPKERINTIIDFAAAAKYGVNTAGNTEGANADVMRELAGQINEGTLEFIVERAYPLTQVKAAYDELDNRHTHGKLVLLP